MEIGFCDLFGLCLLTLSVSVCQMGVFYSGGVVQYNLGLTLRLKLQLHLSAPGLFDRHTAIFRKCDSSFPKTFPFEIPNPDTETDGNRTSLFRSCDT